jgi:hypothetical protein
MVKMEQQRDHIMEEVRKSLYNDLIVKCLKIGIAFLALHSVVRNANMAYHHALVNKRIVLLFTLYCIM